jgi:hypothetical protein
MFTTTVRLRRMRRDTLAKLPARAAKLLDDAARAKGDATRAPVEMWVHGKLCAVAYVDVEGAVSATVVWTRQELADHANAGVVQTLFEAAVIAMRGGEVLAEQDAEDDAAHTSLRGRAARTSGRGA